jgi:dTDP-4-amino-4,6-dideoxygalactose transaminase
MPDVLAALGLAQMERWREFNMRRAKLAEIYFEGLKGISGIDLPEVPQYDHVHAWHLFVIKILALNRVEFMNRLSDYNIGYGLHFPPTHTLKYVKEKYAKNIGLLAETDRSAQGIISLPLFPDMREQDVKYVCKAIKEIIKNG